MTTRVRFAPSPTGNVHIGNIRAAIFNWLFARHNDGAFLLRVEDTDLERCTPDAIANLLDCMRWLGLDHDEEPLYQTSQRDRHLAAADKLLADGAAYKSAKGGKGEAIVFRIPWDAGSVPGVRTTGAVELNVHPDQPVQIDAAGINYAMVSKKGKPVPQAACLAGFRDLEILDADGNVLFTLNDKIEGLLEGGQTYEVDKAVTFKFTRREVAFTDLIRGELVKPLDSMKDQVIVRSDGSPVFHLANVCDDATQGVTHIIRGDDHVENTYRHLFLFRALGETPPQYAHLPMIVNEQGKPYSKRDGAAFVGEFKERGFLPDALLNYLALLGWSPGDDREKLSRDELVELFSLDRVQKAPAQMDLRKLENLNGRYIAEMPFPDFLILCRNYAKRYDWNEQADAEQFAEVASLMQTRTKRLENLETWVHFFQDLPEYDEKACRKFLTKPGIGDALVMLREKLANAEFTAAALETEVNKVTEIVGLKQGKLNQPLRIALTGVTIGAGIYETMEVLGRDTILKRLDYARETYCTAE